MELSSSMPFPLDWTSLFPIRKRFLHSNGNLIRYCTTVYYSSMNHVLRFMIHICVLFCNHVSSHLPPLRFLTLVVSHLPYFLMILTTTCALLIKRCSAHLHMLRFPLPMKFTSTWESQKPFSSAPQVPTIYIRILCAY